MTTWYRREPDGSFSLFVHAQPGARRTEVAGLHGGALKVRIAAPALEDRANDALVEFVAGRLGLARSEVSLIAGGKSREKRLRLPAGADPSILLAAP